MMSYASRKRGMFAFDSWWVVHAPGRPETVRLLVVVFGMVSLGLFILMCKTGGPTAHSENLWADPCRTTMCSAWLAPCAHMCFAAMCSALCTIWMYVEACQGYLVDKHARKQRDQRRGEAVSATCMGSRWCMFVLSWQTSGSYGHVSIVIPRPSRIYRPDQTAAELAAGMQPMATPAGRSVA